jgi:hypothetical protein
VKVAARTAALVFGNLSSIGQADDAVRPAKLLQFRF